MAFDPATFLSTVTAAALGAFSAAAVGYRYALAKFRRERTFDKQLAWYEKATKALIETANRLNWALASELAQIPEAERRHAWAEAHSALVGLRGLQVESEMYASPESYEALSEATMDVTALARSIWAFPKSSEAGDGPSQKRLYEIATKLLYHAASRLAADVREHLELPDIPREWRLYDQAMRELHAEREQLRAKGADFEVATGERGGAARQPPA